MDPAPFRDEVDIGQWNGREPQELLTDPALVEWVTAEAEAAYALTYAYRDGAYLYDDVGFRVMAASLHSGLVPLQTRVSARRALGARRWAERDPDRATAVEEQLGLRHRPIEPPEGQVRYTVDGTHFNLMRDLKDAAGRPYEETWTFPLTAPGRWVLETAAEDDAPLAASRQLAPRTVRGFWLPLRRLIGVGRFERMQACRQHLVSDIAVDRLYVFLSHRWLSVAEPDPDALQARLVAWQLLVSLCEAIAVAARRGLHTPRKYSNWLGVAVGLAGSDLAEMMLVNVLRPVLSTDARRAAAAEIETLEDLLVDGGVQSALDDPGLGRLARIIDERPELAALVDRIHLWYDYSCLPQPPRTREEDALFRDGLDLVTAFQMTDTTAIVLGDPDEHLSRGWCALEAMTADAYRRSNLLVGSPRPAAVAGDAEIAFKLLLADQPHIVWRAVLDTEVFATQGPATCMARLGLALTDERDLPFVYARLRDLGAPESIHTDNSEILTGTFPLAVLPGTGTVLVPTAVGGRPLEAREWRPRASLDWTGALHVGESWTAGHDAADTPPFIAFEAALGGAPWRASCHVAIVAACEGEAVLFAAWVLRRRRELERAVDASIASLSWLASDIAPVGHFVHGSLTARPVDSQLWVIVSTRSRLTGCGVTMTLGETMAMAGLRRISVDLSASVDNVAFLDHATREETQSAVQDNRVAQATIDHDFIVHRGGMFKWGIEQGML